jgi:hypothetical protein
MGNMPMRLRLLSRSKLLWPHIISNGQKIDLAEMTALSLAFSLAVAVAVVVYPAELTVGLLSYSSAWRLPVLSPDAVVW